MQADQSQITRLLKTARGQIDGILKMAEEDRYCMDISNQLMATEAMIRKTNKEILRAHMKGCIADALAENNGDEKVDELIELIDKFAK